jgi:hypothetical protein
LCSDRIHEILREEPNNINLWVMYIEFQYYAGISIEECINCYLSYISTLSPPNFNEEGNTGCKSDHNNMVEMLDKLGGLYWLSEFIYRYGYQKKDPSTQHSVLSDRIVVLTILKLILLA